MTPSPDPNRSSRKSAQRLSLREPSESTINPQTLQSATNLLLKASESLLVKNRPHAAIRIVGSALRAIGVNDASRAIVPRTTKIILAAASILFAAGAAVASTEKVLALAKPHLRERLNDALDDQLDPILDELTISYFNELDAHIDDPEIRELLLRQMYTHARKHLAKDDETTIEILSRLGDTLCDQEKWEEAGRYYQVLLSRLKNTPHTLVAAQTMRSLANCFAHQDNEALSGEALRKSLDFLGETPEICNLDAVEWLEERAWLWCALGKHASNTENSKVAAHYFNKALDALDYMRREYKIEFRDLHVECLTGNILAELGIRQLATAFAHVHALKNLCKSDCQEITRHNAIVEEFFGWTYTEIGRALKACLEDDNDEERDDCELPGAFIDLMLETGFTDPEREHTFVPLCLATLSQSDPRGATLRADINDAVHSAFGTAHKHFVSALDFYESVYPKCTEDIKRMLEILVQSSERIGNDGDITNYRQRLAAYVPVRIDERLQSDDFQRSMEA
jgi:tetratricopeptide (TPR) repeat protein